MQSFYLYLSFLVFTTRKLGTSAMTKESRAFLDGHNSRRLQVAKGEIKRQPGSSDMKIMMWDNELYLKAAAYAATLPRKHNPNTSVPSGRFETGENLYWYSTTDHSHKFDPDAALEAWFSEHRDYTYGPIRDSDFSGSKEHLIGHYTQMVWADSIYVGCAVAQNYEGKWKKFYVVCNYGPGGNYIGEEPYKRGKPSKRLICGCDNDSGEESCSCA